MKIIILISALFLGSVLCEIFDRPCRTNVPAKENFSPAYYIGTWFELFYSDYEFEGECMTHHYTRRGLEQVFDVESLYNINGQYILLETEVKIAFPDEVPMRGLFNATVDFGGRINEYAYQVYVTDYTNISILWVCHDLENNQSEENVAVLSRGLTISETTLMKVDALVAQLGFDRTTFKVVDHSDEKCLTRGG